MLANLMRSAWFRRSGIFWAGMALMLGTMLAWSTPASAASRVRQTRVAGGGRWIEVDLSSQRLNAWQGGRRVFSTVISSGKRSTPTPLGTYRIQRRYASKRMGSYRGVPYAMYFHRGYAIHGAYWHKKFGTPVSHGCVNLRTGQARQLFAWAGLGTRVVVHR